MAFTKCGICKVPLHDGPKKGVCKGYECFTQYHSDATFGLASQDCKLFGKKKDEWIPPTPDDITQNTRRIQQIQRNILYALRGQVNRVEDSI